MEKNRSKVLMSILIVALCLSVCIGLTYAYFTDTASSKGNKIQAGSLKLDLQLYDQIGGWHSIKDSQDPVFNYDKWEPGYVDAKLLRVVNLGNLALKWEAKLVSTEAVSQYANVIEVYVQTSNSEMPYPASRAEALAWTHVGSLDDFINTTQQIANGIFTAQGESAYISIALYMPAEIEDNNLQGQVLGEFDIQINATQYTYEEDAIGSDYDTSARFPEGGVNPPDDTEDTTEPTETEPEPTETEPGDTDEPVEPSDPSIFTWRLNDDDTYTITGLKSGVTIPTNLVIPSTYNGLDVTVIANNAFKNKSTITNVTIPNSVTTIGNFAFSGCAGLSNLTIGNNVTTIGRGAFYNCSALTGKLTIPDSVITIGASAFWNCDGLTELAFGNSVTIIDEDAFKYCDGLTEITFPNSITTIGARAFERCSNLQNVTIPNGIERISAAFPDCPNLVYYEDDNAYYLGNESNEYLVLVKVKDTTIESFTFNENTKIIYSEAFAGCYYLQDIEIPNQIVQIGWQAFIFSGLKSIIIPESVTAIGGHAFLFCDSNLIIYCKAAAPLDDWGSMWDCSIEICDEDGNCPRIPVVWGWTGESNEPNKPTESNDPPEPTDPSLFSFSINDDGISCTLTRLKDGVYLKNIIIPSTYNGYTVTAIGSGAFSGDDYIKSVTIPDSVTTIDEAAFSWCTSLTNITISDSVTTIGSNVFADCYNLMSITFEGTVEQWNALGVENNWTYGPSVEVRCSDGITWLSFYSGEEPA